MEPVAASVAAPVAEFFRKERREGFLIDIAVEEVRGRWIRLTNNVSRPHHLLSLTMVGDAAKSRPKTPFDRYLAGRWRKARQKSRLARILKK